LFTLTKQNKQTRNDPLNMYVCLVRLPPTPTYANISISLLFTAVRMRQIYVVMCVHVYEICPTHITHCACAWKRTANQSCVCVMFGFTSSTDACVINFLFSFLWLCLNSFLNVSVECFNVHSDHSQRMF